ncbi:Pisatin demethylase [Colletotrichum siamense]|uniref:Pisatin demethylase n=1 Tax=Colletotrichum siamense TaxID=690259 RepID=A0A9P5EFU7_COLSI|nr:Pisatin demethylase [Colletotrichum siamense]KAF4850124.1 Pisatin demethylase [Colletotrichum siamense]
MNVQLLLAIGTFVFLVEFTAALVNWIRSPLRSVPGPFLARVTDLWYLYHVRQGSFEKVNIKLHEKYGSIVRYGPNRYSINNAESSKTIYGHATQFRKSDWYSATTPDNRLVNIFAEQDIKRHAYSRRFYSSPYSMTSLVHYEPYLDECGALFCQRLGEFSRAGISADFGHWFQCFAFDAIAMMTYGRRLGFLDQGEDVSNVMENINMTLIYSSVVGIYPSLHKYAMSILRAFDRFFGDGTAMFVPKFTQKIIDDERASPKLVVDVQGQEDGVAAKESFLTKFLAKHSSDPKFTNDYVLAGCAANMFAGSDTTGLSLSAILYNLLKSQDSMGKLRQEIDEFTSRGELSEAPTFKESQQMPYLQAVIKEALRVHPAVGIPLERVVPEGGATIGGRFFPEGSVVGINSWVQHRDRSLFGDDADHFRPDRWLVNDEAKLSVMNRNWTPFGLGSRTCLGKNISILEISKLIPRIVRDFDFQLEGTAAAPGGSWETCNVFFVKPKNFYVKVQPRRTI